MNHITIVSPGKTTLKRGEVISRDAFDKENERVSRLGEKPAEGMYFNEEGEAIEVPFSTNGEPPEESSMEVRLWTGTKIPVSNREEAVEVIKRELEGWKQEGDRIVWYKKEETDSLPSIAYVMDSVGELTDASAIIVDLESRR